MTADLRRLAEAGIAGTVGRVTPETWQAILALLDERDHDRELIGTLAEWQAVAESRVAALEKGLRDLWECWDTGQDDDVLDVHFQAARALLAAAPSVKVRTEE